MKKYFAFALSAFVIFSACNAGQHTPIKTETDTTQSTSSVDSMPVVKPQGTDTSHVVTPPATNDSNVVVPDTTGKK